MRYLSSRLFGAVVLTLLCGWLAGSVACAQATIEDCEKITAADAYNQCLAKFGPTSKVKSLEPEKPSDFKSGPAEAAATAAPKARASRHAGGRRRGRATRGGGRKHMTIGVRRRRHR